MNNALTILRRDLRAYYTSPIGYIFMIVFVLISVGLYITSFFTFPVADMRPFFNNLPLLLCVFIPAVTMRVWAEERKENTWEMLLTFPMKSWQLVVGKFLATLVFFALTVAATFTIPLMLANLGNPDPGVIAGGYFGTILLGAFFLSIGIFFSGFFKDQIVAFVVTLLACFAIFLLGTDFIAGYIDGVWPGFGSLLSSLVGMSSHYNSFTRGVFEAADFLYFAAWTALFLILNILYIEGRNRPKAGTVFAVAVALCLAIGFLFNWAINGETLARWDATEDKIYTMSEASKTVLASLESPAKLKVYITPRGEMPTGMTTLEQDIVDKLDEMRVNASGKLDYSVVYLSASNVVSTAEEELQEGEEADEEKSIEKRMLDKGVEPFSVRAMSGDEVTNKLVYSSIGVGYRDKKEEIIPQIMPATIEELEYRLVSTIYKLRQEKAPVVALVAPKEAITIDPQYRRMLEQMGQEVPQSDDPYVYLEQILTYEKYEVQRVEMTQESPLPEAYDVLAVVNPRQLNERQRWEIARAAASGKPVLLAVQQYEWDYRPTGRGMNVNRRDENPQINELLSQYGIEVSPDILLDNSNAQLQVQGGGNSLQAMLGIGQPVTLPTQVLVSNAGMNPETSITSRLAMVFYLWGTALKFDDEKLQKHGLEVATLMNSSEQSWTVSPEAFTEANFKGPADGQYSQYPLMAMVTGQFPDVFKDQPRPAWPEEPPMPGQPPKPPVPEEGEATPIEPKPGKMIVVGCSEMFRKNFIQGGPHLDLFLNSVDALALGDELVNVRSRKPIDRTISRPTPAVRNTWRFVNYGLATAIIAAVGIVTTVMRRRARNAYTIAYSAPSNNEA